MLCSILVSAYIYVHELENFTLLYGDISNDSYGVDAMKQGVKC
jgi:hypothetical protein